MRDPEDGYYKRRHALCRLTLSTSTVFAELATPAGVQMFFQHITWWGALGRVLSAEVKGGALLGDVAINNLDLMREAPGGLTGLDRGINTGLSLGFMPIGEPTLKARGRQRERPGPVDLWQDPDP